MVEVPEAALEDHAGRAVLREIVQSVNGIASDTNVLDLALLLQELQGWHYLCQNQILAGIDKSREGMENSMESRKSS
jgi:hypothetical protein